MPSKRWSISAILIVLFASTSFAADGISRNDWIYNMLTAMPPAFCQSEQYFLQCYRVTQSKCKEIASSSIKTCFEQNLNDIPARIVSQDVSMYWGMFIGKCAGEVYESILKEKRIRNSMCDNPDNWM